MTSLLNIAGNVPTDAFAEGSSLRFEDGDSAYLNRTPASAGNRKTWTWSGWVKRGNLTTTHNTLFMGRSSPVSNAVGIVDNQVRFYSYNGSGFDFQKKSSAVLRDPSAWYHIVAVFDSSNATAADRAKIYINGERVTSFASSSDPSLNFDGQISNNVQQTLGQDGTGSEIFDGYLANVAFIDGQALTPASFGEYEDTLWKPKSDTAIQALTFGTNGFYLPMKQTTEAEGFSTVTYTGNGGTQSIEGVGFEPDFVWYKSRSISASNHVVFDSIRGATNYLLPNTTGSEATATNALTSFDSGGFSVGNEVGTNNAGSTYVAWCWDAGTGSAVSNTDGSITSTVKANTTNGFSIVSWTDNANTSSTVGHGLNSTPELIITKNRDGAFNWFTWTTVIDGSYDYLNLNLTSSKTDDSTRALPTSSVFTNVGSTSGNKQIAYCFHSVSGYSKISSYSGTGASGNSITGLGFKPAWLMIKRTDASGDSWVIHDNTRTPSGTVDEILLANSSSAELTNASYAVDFDADGFTLQTTNVGWNASGGTYIYMAFADTRDATFFGDTSGNSNNWTPNALNNTDVVPDSPVTNFATLNPLDKNSNVTLSEGNLQIDTSAINFGARSTYLLNSGKWYYEAYNINGTLVPTYGAASPSWGLTYVGSAGSYGYGAGGTIYVDAPNGTNQTGVATYTAGDVIGIALNMDDNEITFFKNNTQVGTTLTGVLSPLSPAFAGQTGSSSMVNFGQDSSFAGNETPQGNTDDNGQGDFYYAPPSGFLALTRNNLPSPDILDPADYFNTVLWTGDGSAQSITGVGFQPDFVWTKSRNNSYNHLLYDAVRGATSGSTDTALYSSTADYENTYGILYHNLASFDADGFTTGLSTSTDVFNSSGLTQVSWNWLADTAFSNSAGTNGADLASTGHVNQDAGFSIVSFDLEATGSKTVLHGLSSAPEMIIVKSRDAAALWVVYTEPTGNTTYLSLNDDAGATTNSTTWDNTSPTSSVFTLGSGFTTANYGTRQIAYCFHSVEGYSKIGSYTGSTSLPFVHCGFRPSFLIVKRLGATDSGWLMVDSKRNSVNVVDANLFPNVSLAENSITGFLDADFLANGFKLRTSNAASNASGEAYLFYAVAEAPFKNANAR